MGGLFCYKVFAISRIMRYSRITESSQSRSYLRIMTT
jgi:hypothetical protein